MSYIFAICPVCYEKKEKKNGCTEFV